MFLLITKTLKAFLPSMMASNHGHLVSIASLAGINGNARMTDYCASKFAAVGIEESVRLELRTGGFTGINSTVVCPFYINTGMFAGVNTGYATFITRQIIPEIIPDEAGFFLFSVPFLSWRQTTWPTR